MAITLSKDIRSAATPDNLAVDTILEIYWTRICRTLFGLLGDWDEAEDLALETFFRWHQQSPRDQSNPAGWLYRVATNLGLNALRARQRRQSYEIQAETLALDTDLEDAVEKAQETDRVRQVLGMLKPRSAQLLLLRHSGMSYAEIAAQLDLAPGSVGSLLARATQEFEERYQQLAGE